MRNLLIALRSLPSWSARSVQLACGAALQPSDAVAACHHRQLTALLAMLACHLVPAHEQKILQQPAHAQGIKDAHSVSVGAISRPCPRQQAPLCASTASATPALVLWDWLHDAMNCSKQSRGKVD